MEEERGSHRLSKGWKEERYQIRLSIKLDPLPPRRYITFCLAMSGLAQHIFRRTAHSPEDRPKPPRNGPASTSTADTLNPPEQPQITAAQERRSNWRIIKNLMVNVWPKNDWKTRGTVILGFAFLISGKVLNVQVPLLFKQIIDSLNLPLDPSSSTTVWTIAGATVLGYGAARVGASVFSELLNAVFANIGQRAIRKVARETFEQLLNMDMKFHLARQTGGLTRAIDRGTKHHVPPSGYSL
ncbi:iron-sulfur clusters transporter ATM1 [Lentinula edodes]|uniref:Iron-sulfur clusters transporter ATM1 n=1 Tax=Lentinula edodes TaxID=5353 RepID=A0A1Q3DWV7_LENED|nr:iron-sulfur clusters transporter ATM1 [Lentinula edodes]